jgi:hypothetical protein
MYTRIAFCPKCHDTSGKCECCAWELPTAKCLQCTGLINVQSIVGGSLFCSSCRLMWRQWLAGAKVGA